MTAKYRRDFVPEAVLASQVGGAAGVPGFHLQSSHLQRQLEGLLNQNGCWREQRCHRCSPSAFPQPIAVSMTLLSQHQTHHVEAFICTDICLKHT